MQVFNQRIHAALAERQTQGLTRRLTVLEAGNRSMLSAGGKRFSNFSGNDYLGLAADPELVKAWQDGLSLYGAGSGASPLVSGFSPAHQRLEQTLCEWLGYERAVLFGSGFSANQAVLFTLLEKGDLLVQDRLNHASLMEAGMLSPARMQRFRHNDTTHLQRILAETPSSLVVTEGVFSMDGDQAPLADISAMCRESDSWLMVDDAHGLGVLGPEGAGSCAQAGVQPDLLIATFGKAFGLSGAAVLCDSQTGDYLTQFARHHVYSTAMPPSQAHALNHAAQMIRSQQWRRHKLTELQAIYQRHLQQSEGYVETRTAIKPYLCGSAEYALDAADTLRSQGFWVTAIRPPTVPRGSARLRITLTAAHSTEQVEGLAQAIARLTNE